MINYRVDCPIGFDPLAGPTPEEEIEIYKYADELEKKKKEIEASLIKNWKDRND